MIGKKVNSRYYNDIKIIGEYLEDGYTIYIIRDNNGHIQHIRPQSINEVKEDFFEDLNPEIERLTNDVISLGEYNSYLLDRLEKLNKEKKRT